MSFDTDDMRKMNRRRFVQALTGLGISAGTVSYLTRDVLAEKSENARDEVPRLYGRTVKNPEEQKGKRPSKNNRPEMEEMWYTIPRSKWVRVETAQNAAKSLQSQMDELDSSGLLEVAVRSEYDRPRSEKRLVVHYTTYERETEEEDSETVASPNVSFERVEEEAPYSVTGVVGEGKHREEVDVEVSVKRTTKQEDACTWSGSYYDHYYDDCPAGADTGCTTGPPGYHSTYGYVMTSAGHCYDIGETVYQPGGGQELGEVKLREYHGDGDPATSDMCVIDPIRNSHYYLASDSGDNQYDEYLAGTMSWTTITDMEDDSLQSMEKQGSTTGRCGGQVVETYPGKTVKTFEIGAARAGGDSGGPHFSIIDGYAYISGLHRGKGDAGYAEAVYWEDQYDRFGMSFR